jgi:hypothetical protein
MLDDVFVLNEPVCSGCAQPRSSGPCTCHGHKHQAPHRPRPSYFGANVANVQVPTPLGQPEWDFAPVTNERRAHVEPETVYNTRSPIGLGEPDWDFANPMDAPKPQAAVPTRNRAAGVPEPMPQFEWNW